MGRTLRPIKLVIAKATIKEIQELKDPTTETQVRFFLGFYNVFRRFVPNYLQIAALLHEKLRKQQLNTFSGLRTDIDEDGK